jgi:hypothetical protein
MRLIIILALSIVLSVSLTYVLHQPSVHSQLISWSQQATRSIGEKVGAPPSSEGRSRSLDDDEDTSLQIDPMFWLNQGLNLVYVFLGVGLSELVRGRDRRKYGP